MVGGNDIKRLSMMDASFADALSKALTGLTIGRAVVKVTARPGEQQPPPVIVQMDYVQHEVRRSNIYTRAYDPGEAVKADLKSMLNPVLKYVDPVRPLELFALYEVYRAKKVALTDLATRLGAPRKDLEDAVSRLAALGYVEVEREGNRKVLAYAKGLFKGLKRAAPSEEGYRVARRALLKYYGKGYTVVPAKQDPSLGAKPDLVAIPVDKATWRPLYSEAVAIEVESCNELETHPEHVVHNWLKESTKDFAEVHSWTDERCFDRLRRLHEKHPDIHGKVKVFSARVKERARPVATGVASGTPAGGAGSGEVERGTTAKALAPMERQGVAAGSAATAAAVDDRVRVVEVAGKRYRVVFRSAEDAARFDKLSRGSALELSGNRLRAYIRSVGKKVEFYIEKAEEALT